MTPKKSNDRILPIIRNIITGAVYSGATATGGSGNFTKGAYRMSVIDWSNDVFYINHTVTTLKVDGVKRIIAKERAKTNQA